MDRSILWLVCCFAVLLAASSCMRAVFEADVVRFCVNSGKDYVNGDCVSPGVR
jgi:hypothetical protein